LAGWPLSLTATWILVLKPPRERPNAWESCPLLRPPHVGGLEQSSSRARGLITPRRPRAYRATVPRPRVCTNDRIVCRPNSMARIVRASPSTEPRSLQSRTQHSRTNGCPGPFFRDRRPCQVSEVRLLPIVHPRFRVAASLRSSVSQMMRNYLPQNGKPLKANVHTT
jgi:hypothetical protein